MNPLFVNGEVWYTWFIVTLTLMPRVRRKTKGRTAKGKTLGRPRKIEGEQYALLLPESLERRISAHLARLQRRAPFATVTKADAVRDLIERGLEAPGRSGEDGDTEGDDG